MALDITIVGAGLMGLSAALVLGRHGHNVVILEKSSFTRPTGSALQVNPPTMRILQDELRLDRSILRPTFIKFWRFCTDLVVGAQGHTAWEYDEMAAKCGISDHPMATMARADIHTALMKAVEPLPNVRIELSTMVQSFDPATATVTLLNGASRSADLVVGADGIHSIASKHLTSYTTGRTGYDDRWLFTFYRYAVPAKRAFDDPAVAPFLNGWDSMHCCSVFRNPAAGPGGPSGHVLFGFRNDEEIYGNLAQAGDIHRPPPERDWSIPLSHHELVDKMKSFPAHFQGLANLATEQQETYLVHRDYPASLVNGRLVCIGDAAHQISPTFAAAAGIGFEESVVLGALLGSEVTSDMVEARLRLFNDLRHERGAIIKLSSEVNLPSLPTKQVVPGIEPIKDFREAVEYLWSHDGIEEARKRVATGSSGLS